MMNVFTFVAAINTKKSDDLFKEPEAEKEYIPYLVNKAFSYFPDTILYVNEININHNIPKQWQFDFLMNSIPKRNRFSKWSKKESTPQDVMTIVEYYGYSVKKATEVIDLFTNDQLQQIKQNHLMKGGKIIQLK